MLYKYPFTMAPVEQGHDLKIILKFEKGYISMHMSQLFGKDIISRGYFRGKNVPCVKILDT